MRRRFFVDQVRNGHAEISGADARHLTRVLRAEAGQQYEISDNQNVYLAEIETARKERVVFRTIEQVEARELPVRLALCAALIKFDRFEWMIEKATELGAAEIIPVTTARAERGLERAARKRLERWRRVALEASQQCRRVRLPEVAAPVVWREALANSSMYKYVLDEDAGAQPFPAALPATRTSLDTVAVLIGPEGGWTD